MTGIATSSSKAVDMYLISLLYRFNFLSISAYANLSRQEYVISNPTGPCSLSNYSFDVFCQNCYCHSMPSFGETIRYLRSKQNVPLRVVAAAVEIDSTLLSRFELGERFPTAEQLARFANYFQLPLDELSAQVIADRIIATYGTDEVATRAADMVRERLSEYGRRR
jgi:transcriptional regulator with XRE-family HTH domain